MQEYGTAVNESLVISPSSPLYLPASHFMICGDKTLPGDCTIDQNGAD